MRGLRVFDAGLDSFDVAVDVSIGNENVEPAVQIVIEKETAEAECKQSGASDCRAGRLVNKQAVAFIVVQGKHLIREVGDHYTRISRPVVVRRVHAHSGTCNPLFAEGDAGQNAAFSKAALSVVDVQPIGLCVVGEKDIRPEILICVKHGNAQRFGCIVQQTGCPCCIFECPVATVPPKTHGRSLVGFRRTVGLSCSIQCAKQIRLGCPLNIVPNNQIQIPVAVEIQPRGARAEFARTGEARLFGDIGEDAFIVPE